MDAKCETMYAVEGRVISPEPRKIYFGFAKGK